MENINIAEIYAKNAIESTVDFTKEVVYELIKKAYIDGSTADDSGELQLLDVDDIEEDLQIEEYSDAIDANDFLSKLS